MSDTREHDSQPTPIHNNKPASWKLVISDMEARDNHGRKKYGTPLQPQNGRDSLQDAYEEALDLVVYLKNLIEERKLEKGKASRLMQEYINRPEMAGKNVAQLTALDIRDLLREAKL